MFVIESLGKWQEGKGVSNVEGKGVNLSWKCGSVFAENYEIWYQAGTVYSDRSRNDLKDEL